MFFLVMDLRLVWGGILRIKETLDYMYFRRSEIFTNGSQESESMGASFWVTNGFRSMNPKAFTDYCKYPYSVR